MCIWTHAHNFIFLSFVWPPSFVLLNWVSSTEWEPFSFQLQRRWEWSKELCMAGQRVGETGLSESGPSSHHVPYGVLHGINTSAAGLMYSLNYFSISVLSTLRRFRFSQTYIITEFPYMELLLYGVSSFLCMCALF